MSKGSANKTNTATSAGGALLPPVEGPELVIGVVGAVGTDLGLVCDVLQEELAKVKYESTIIRLSELLHEIKKYKNIPNSPAYARYDKHMTAGTDFRTTMGHGGALALLAVGRIRERRKVIAKHEANAPVALQNHAFILRSLKHPDEITTLRRIYGRAFCAVSAYSSRDQRIDRLSAELCASEHGSDKTAYRDKAEILIRRDEEELDTPLGQDVKDAFPLGDVFVRVDGRQSVQRDIARFVEMLFGHPYHTPNKDEYGMFFARASALRSSDLSRQVGAVITTPDGDLISVGCNEVPQPGGGQYWPGEKDNRDFQVGYDSSVRAKQEMLAEVLHRLQKAGWLDPAKSTKDIDAMVSEAISSGEKSLMANARIMNVLEFGRIVHAEMAALMDAARRGLRVSGGTLYSTTFPCHNCARHIVAAGIGRVVYIEPYPKSMARELYPDSIKDDYEGSTSHTTFAPFVGIAPRRYMELFDMPKRKSRDGKIINWKPGDARPRLDRMNTTYLLTETMAVQKLSEKMQTVGLG
jgi:cytidine deaminase